MHCGPRGAGDFVKMVPVLSAALYERFSSRGEDDFAEKVLSAWRFQFGGHPVKAADSKAGA